MPPDGGQLLDRFGFPVWDRHGQGCQCPQCRREVSRDRPDACQTDPTYNRLIVREFAGSPRGPLPLRADPTCPWDAATKAYVDGTQTRAALGRSPPRNPNPGDLWWSVSVGQMYVWVTNGGPCGEGSWIIANNTGIQDAPRNGLIYGRRNGEWERILGLDGGELTGPLILARDPLLPMEAVTLQFLQNFVHNALTGYLPLSGGTLTGSLTLAGDPVQPLQAVTLQYLNQTLGTVTVAPVAPANPVQGKLWFDSISCQLFIWYRQNGQAQWVQTNAPAFGGGQPGGYFGGIYYGDSAPEHPKLGTIWITSLGLMYAWNGSVWVQVGGTGIGDVHYGPVPPSDPTLGSLWVTPAGNMYVWNGGNWISISMIYVGDTAPTNASDGDLWWSTLAGAMFIYYDDGSDEPQWVITDPKGTGRDKPVS